MFWLACSYINIPILSLAQFGGDIYIYAYEGLILDWPRSRLHKIPMNLTHTYMCLLVKFFLPCICTSFPLLAVNSMKYFPTVIWEDKYYDHIFDQ